MLGDLLSREKSRDVRNELKERISEIWKRTFDTAFYQVRVCVYY